MMAKAHAATGAAGMALIGLTPYVFAGDLLLLLAIFLSAGYALWPDMDHPKALAATTWGFVSKWFANIVETISQWIYYATKTRKDVNRRGGHRTLTHTFMFALLSGACTFFASENIYAKCFIIFFGLCLGLRGLFPKTTNKTGKVFVYLLASLIPAYMFVGEIEIFTNFQLALIVTIGSAIHSLGDCLTDSGAPLLWPLPIKGQVWYRFKVPEHFRFSTGSADGEYIENFMKIGCIVTIVIVFIIRHFGEILTWTASHRG